MTRGEDYTSNFEDVALLGLSIILGTVARVLKLSVCLLFTFSQNSALSTGQALSSIHIDDETVDFPSKFYINF